MATPASNDSPYSGKVTVRRSLPFIVIVFLGCLLYGPSLNAPFYLDDAWGIYDNLLVKDLQKALSMVFAKRGLCTLTFAVNYQLNGLNVVGYHIVNIAIHLGASCLVLLLLRRVFPRQPWLQMFGALLFVVHPLQTQAVTYLVQRMTSLSALLFLLAVYLYVLARERLAMVAKFFDRRHLVCYGGSLLAGGMSILAKENAVILPFALVLFDKLFIDERFNNRASMIRYLVPFAVLPMVAICAYLVIPLLTGTGLGTTGYSQYLRSMAGNSPLHYLATQCSVLWIYIRMLFLPYGQALDHAYPVSRELLTIKSVAGGLGVIGLIAFGWQLRDRQPAIAGGILWFFLALAVESSLIPLDPLFEHRLYLPMFGFSLALPALMTLLPYQRISICLMVLAILAFSVLTWQRNALWDDKIAFFRDNLKTAPENERVYFNLGQEYVRLGVFDEGERLIRESIALNPLPDITYLALNDLYLAQNRLDEAVAMLQYGLDHVDQEHKSILYNDLAFIYGKKGDFALALEVQQQAINAAPQVAAPYYNMAQLLMFAGEQDMAIQHLLKALELDPGHADARIMLDNLQKGQPWNSSPAQHGRH